MHKLPQIPIFPLLAAALALAAADAPAQSHVSWSVDSVCGYFDWDEDGAVDHTRFTYIVLNTSTPGDANNLVSFTVFAGADRGVWLARHPEGWLADILADRTVFSGNGNYIAPNGEHTFELYSRLTRTAVGVAQAMRSGSPEFPYVPFPTTLAVAVPAHAPPALALARAATNAFAVAVSSADAQTFLLQYRDTLAPTNWIDLARFAVTGAVTVVTDTNAAPARFYRVVVP